MAKKEELVEIKKNMVGHGLLIENDGYMTLNEGAKNLALKESIDSANGWHVPHPFIVSAVFQKFGIKNANGRIYPEKVLKREVEKYQQKILEHRALGECYKPDALVLTEEGWKTLEDVKEGENVLTLNTDTMQIEIKPILRKIEKDWNGDMIHIQNRNIDDVVTPNHEYILLDRDGSYWGRCTAEDILERRVKTQDKKYIPRKNKRSISLNRRYLKAFKEHYEGKVMCIEVENHNFYVMCNNKCHWTSNCNHPADTTINLSRVSHNITELHWEGHTLVGEMELNTSEGFRKHGIVTTCGDEVANLLMNGYKIGVSSRGCGSVESRLGQYIVGEDFELIAVDVVSDPSTPNAYISVNGKEELTPYIENNNANSSKNQLLEDKLKKINNLLS